jgi:DNA-binding transcriptional ArsR family regulator
LYIIIKLPLGAGLAENTKLQGTGLRQYEPEWGTGGSDGRRIFVQWKLDNPQLGRTLDISVIYENILSTANITSIAILAVIVIVFIAMILAFRKHEIRDLLPVLTESERKVVEILLKERKEVDQRKLVREIDYSKSKISRTLQNLQARGIVEIRRKGRTNIITLKTNKQKSPERVENK